MMQLTGKGINMMLTGGSTPPQPASTTTVEEQAKLNQLNKLLRKHAVRTAATLFG
jgi:hypothetical protein